MLCTTALSVLANPVTVCVYTPVQSRLAPTRMRMLASPMTGALPADRAVSGRRLSRRRAAFTAGSTSGAILPSSHARTTCLQVRTSSSSAKRPLPVNTPRRRPDASRGAAFSVGHDEKGGRDEQKGDLLAIEKWHVVEKRRKRNEIDDRQKGDPHRRVAASQLVHEDRTVGEDELEDQLVDVWVGDACHL